MAEQRETMANVDVTWLRMDDPTNLMMITGVLTFKTPVTYERLYSLLETRLLRFARFRQRVSPERTTLGMRQWEEDPHFDLNAHMRRAALPSPAGHKELQTFVSDLMSVPLDPGRPLWFYHLIEDYQGGSAVVVRLHHCIADGIALVRVLLTLTDTCPDAPCDETEAVEEEVRRGPLSREMLRARNALRLTEKVVHEGVEALLEPSRVLEVARQGTGGVLRLGQILARWPDPKTPFKGKLGVPKQAAWSGYLSLADVKAVGKVTGGTVNDVLLTAVSGALRTYMIQRGENPNGLAFHAVVPVNLRPPDEPLRLGNKFGLVFLKLPIGIADEVARLEALKEHMDALKQSPEAVAIFGLLSVVGRAPGEVEDALVQIFATKATTVMTNVPGPREQLYMCGAPLQDIMFWVPQSGRLGLGVSIISYNGRVLLGIASDAGLVPDPEAIVAAFHKEFEKMLRLVTMVEADTDAEKRSTPLRCRATTRSGTRCRNRAQPGSDYCHVHAAA